MEPPSKKTKLGQAPYDDNDDDDEANLDELSMSPTQFDARQDPLYQLDKGRAKAATRLKSAFERIFEKYGKDFTGVGDEIDLETGEVIVNNGHLLSLDDEKDRNREGSVLSNEEEGIIKEKNTRPIEDSGSKSLIPTKSPIHSPSPGLHPGLNQPIMPGEFNHQLLYPGMQLHPFGSPDPFMFGPPMFGSSPVDPLWQSPELPLPIYQDRFGFIGQSMGYHNQPGYRPSIAPGGYNSGFLGPPFHHQIPKKISHVKTTGRKILPHPTPATNDSDEDDILLGDNTQEIAKITTAEKNKASSLASATKKAKQTGRNDTKVDSETVTEQASHTLQKSQRRRPRKVAVSVEQPCSNTRMVSPPPSSENESTIAEQGAEKLAQIEVLIRAMRPSDVHKKSSRSRKQIDSSGQMSKTKNRQGPKTVDLSNSLEEVALEAPDPSPGVDESKEHAESDTSQHREVTQLTISEDFEEIIDNGLVRQANITTPDEESRGDGLLTGHEDTRNNENIGIEVADLPSTLDNSGETDPLFSNNEIDTIMMEMPTDGKTSPLGEPTSPNTNGEEVLDNPQDSDQAANSDNREVNSESSVIGDATFVVETTSYDLMSNEDQDTPIEAQEVNLTRDNSREVTPSLPAAIEPEETIAQLPDLAQEVIHPLSSPILELELPLDHAIIQLDSIEQDSEQLRSHEEEEAISLPAPELAILSPRQISPPAETSELVLRPLPVQSEEADPTDIPNLPINPPSSSTQPASKIIAPSTPKKRSKTSAVLDKTSSSHRTPSTRRNRALTSLIPDDPDQDDDELSILSSSVTASPFITQPDHNIITMTPHRHRPRDSSTPRKSNHRHGFLIGSSTHHTPHRISKHAATAVPPATDSRAFRGTKRRFMASSPVAQSSPLARTMVNVDSVSNLTSTPSRRAKTAAAAAAAVGGVMSPSVMLESSPVRTPGGSARRCGEEGFVCDRDFCFTCCK